MALAFDTTHRPHGNDEWSALLEAIFTANDTDENHALEWKGMVDLRSNADIGKHIARSILAMANRPVDSANAHFDGYGVIIIGLDAGKTYPIEVLDDATLRPRIAGFVGGANGPRWESRYIECHGQECLVIDVSPPRSGDRIFALRKQVPKKNRADGTDQEYLEYLEGTVFTRHGANSPIARQDDLDALIVRATPDTKTKLQVTVGVADAVANCWMVDQANIDRWLDGQTNALLRSIEDNYRVTAEMARLGRSPKVITPNFFQWVDETRTELQFRDEVDRWVLSLRHYTEGLGKSFGRVMGIAPTFFVRNKTDEHIVNLNVTLHVPGEVKAWKKRDEYPDLNYDLPKRPRIFGGYQKSLLAGIGKVRTYVAAPNLGLHPRPTTKITHGGSVTIEPPGFNLRAKRSFTFEDRVMFFVPADRYDITVEWAADSENQPGRPTGTLELTRGEPVDVFGGFLNEFSQTEFDQDF